MEPFQPLSSVFGDRASRAAGTAPTPPPEFEPDTAIDDEADLLAIDGDDLADFAEQAAHDPVSGLTVAIAYRDSRGITSKRLITVRSLTNRRGQTYLNAVCHQCNAFRQFRVDRIAQVIDWRTGEVLADPKAFLDDMTDQNVLRETSGRSSAATPYRAALDACSDGIRVLMFLARCDGHVHSSELHAIEDYCLRQCDRHGIDVGLAELDRLARYADRQHPDGATFLTSAGSVFRNADVEDVQLLLDAVVRLIDADGELSPEEFDFVMELREAAARAGVVIG